MDPKLFALLVSWLIPIIVAFLRRVSWPRLVAFGFTGIVCLIVGALGGIIDGKIDLSGIHDVSAFYQAAIIAFTEAEAVYQLMKSTASGTLILKRLEEGGPKI